MRAASRWVWSMAMLVMSAAACKPGPTATEKGARGECPDVDDRVNCENDGIVTQQEVDDCHARMSDAKCGALYGPYFECHAASLYCASDDRSSSAMDDDCIHARDAYEACLSGG